MSYVERSLAATITLGATPENATPTFAGTASNVVKISGSGSAAMPGVRMSVAIVKAGGALQPKAEIRIFGLPLSIMNQLATLGVPFAYYVARNTILIEAGDVGGAMSTVYEGNITNAWMEGDQAPEVAFNIIANVGALNAAAAAQPTSFTGPADVATILSGLAIRAGYNFINAGVQQTLISPYFSGSILAQIRAVIDHARIESKIDKGTLTIWPHNGSIDGLVPLISPQTGLVGYPRYTTQGIHFRTLFNPGIDYGGRLEMQSSQTPACGIWTVFRIAYDLEDQTPDGAWFMDIDAQQTGPGIAQQV